MTRHVTRKRLSSLSSEEMESAQHAHQKSHESLKWRVNMLKGTEMTQMNKYESDRRKKHQTFKKSAQMQRKEGWDERSPFK